MRFRQAPRAVARTLLLALVATGCSDATTNLASDDAVSGAGGTLAPASDASYPDPIALELCSDGVCACANGDDDDGDGEVDGFDPECTGANDDDEGSFATGIPGDNRDPSWQDCFFDGDSGAGNDGCRYHTECLTGDRDPSDADCQVTQECIDYCQPRTPNGCDCFGCCSVRTPTGAEIDVLIGEDCTFEAIEKCQACVPSSTACTNECGRCELCLGKTPADLPADCYDEDTPTHSCEDGEPVCDETRPCGAGSYCDLGCCLVYVL